MVIVAFRRDKDKLTQVCTKTFKSIAAAKKHIEDDAACWLSKHPGIDLGWIKPKSLDYYCVQEYNDTMCYWQYFKM